MKLYIYRIIYFSSHENTLGFRILVIMYDWIGFLDGCCVSELQLLLYSMHLVSYTIKLSILLLLL